jgi:hypothetical protein
VSEQTVEDKAINLYPNPASDHFYILLKAGQANGIKVYDVSGKVLIADIINTGQEKCKISTAGLKNGMYIVEINTGSQRAFGKLVVAHRN